MKASWFESNEKITLWHNPEYRGADIPDGVEHRTADKDIPLSQLYGFEPDDKMDAKEHGDQVLKIALKMKQGQWNGKPIIVTQTSDGYMILDGHHRFAAARKADLKSLPAIVVDSSEIEHRNDIPKGLTEASGYIPTKAQAKDPRFSSALTVDVKPGETQRQAAKLGMKIDKNGSPPLLHATAAKNTSANKAYNLGLTESLWAQYNAIKESKLDEEELLEVEMSPGSLKQWASSDAAAGIRAGFEMELIFQDTQSDEGSTEEAEPDWERDEEIGNRSIDDVIKWFDDDEFGFGIETTADTTALRQQMNDEFFEKADEWVEGMWEEEGYEQLRSLMDTEVWDKERSTRSDDAAQQLFDADYESLDDSDKTKARQEAWDTYIDDVDEAWNGKWGDQWWEQAYESFRDTRLGDFSWDDFWKSLDYDMMYQISDGYDITWPWLEGGFNEDGRTWEEIEESIVTGPLAGTDFQVTVGSGYHAAARSDNLFILEPDSSLEADNDDAGIEIVSPPMPLGTAMTTLEKMFSWAKGADTYTNGSTGLHMGISVPNSDTVDYVKLVLFSGDKYILEKYGRSQNTYAPSAFEMLQRNSKELARNPNKLIAALDKMHTKLEAAAEEYIRNSVGSHKYISIGIKKGYIEFRSPGGDYLKQDISEILNTMLRFARALQIASDPNAYRQEYQKKLYKLTTNNGNAYVTKFNQLFNDYQAGVITASDLKTRWAEIVTADDAIASLKDIDWSDPHQQRMKVDPPTKRVSLAQKILEPKPSVAADNAADSKQVQQKVQNPVYRYSAQLSDPANQVTTQVSGTVTARNAAEAAREARGELSREYPDLEASAIRLQQQ